MLVDQNITEKDKTQVIRNDSSCRDDASATVDFIDYDDEDGM